MKTLTESIKGSLNEAKAPMIKTKENEFKNECKKNHLNGDIETVEFPTDYDDDIIDYLTEMTDALVAKPFRPADKKFIKDCGVLDDNVIAFVHWVDETTYKEYITYMY